MPTKAAIFPFNERMLPVVRHFNASQNQYDIQKVMTWSGCGLNGKDASFICRHTCVNIPVTIPTLPDDESEWDTLIVDCDVMCNSNSTLDVSKFLGNCLSAGKKIVAVTSQEDLLRADRVWENLLAAYPGRIRIFSSQKSVVRHFDDVGDRYKPISIPILLVGGLVQQCDTLEVVLSLREAFCTHGHRASCITGSNMGLLVGMHSYAHLFGEMTSLSEEEKALRLNEMARTVILNERPELLIIEAPDAIMKYNNIAPNGFGLRTYLMSQALDPDLLICCLPIDLVDESFLNAISQDCLNRYGCPIGAVHVSNVLIDSLRTVQDHQVTCTHTDLSAVQEVLRQTAGNISVPVYDVVSDGAEELFYRIAQTMLN